MFSSFTKALNDAGNQVSKAASSAVKSLQEMNREMEAKATVDDKAWFEEICKVPLQGVPMNDMAFNQFFVNYKNAGVPNEKQRVIQECCRSGNGFTCQQIIQIVKAGDVPLETVGAATWMYPRCVDVANWHNVYSAYDVPNSKEWLKKRIAACPKPTPAMAMAPQMNMQMAPNVAMPGVSITMNSNGMNMGAQPQMQMNTTMNTSGMQSCTLEQRVAALEATITALLTHLNLTHLQVVPGSMNITGPVTQNINVDMGAMMNASMNAAAAANNAAMQAGGVVVQTDMGGMQAQPMGANVQVGMPGVTVNQTSMNDGMGFSMNANSMNAPIAGGNVTASSSSFENVGTNSYSQGSSSAVSATQTQDTNMNFGGMAMSGSVTTTTSSSQSQSSSFSMSGM